MAYSHRNIATEGDHRRLHTSRPCTPASELRMYEDFHDDNAIEPLI
jgi:hypothetical protein